MRWLSSPLAATVAVCAILSALAIPLRSLTTNRVAVEIIPAVALAGAHGPGHAHDFDGMLRIRLLAPLASLKVATTTGDVLWESAALPAGEHETDVKLLLIDDALELHVEADFGDRSNADTALFLTVLPDGVEEQTLYLIGSGRIDDILFYEWNLH